MNISMIDAVNAVTLSDFALDRIEKEQETLTEMLEALKKGQQENVNYCVLNQISTDTDIQIYTLVKELDKLICKVDFTDMVSVLQEKREELLRLQEKNLLLRKAFSPYTYCPKLSQPEA